MRRRRLPQRIRRASPTRARAAVPVRVGLCAGLLVLAVAVAWPPRPPLAAAAPAPPEAAAVEVEGRRLQVAARVVAGRVMVPLRAVAEALGAEVAWDAPRGAVTVRRGGRSVRLFAGSRLACWEEGCARAGLTDVPPLLEGGTAYVPLRAVSSALGYGVRWDAARRTAVIGGPPEPEPAPALRLASPGAGARVTGTARLQAEPSPPVAAAAAEVRYFLLDPETGRGPVVARGSDPAAAYGWLPDPARAGRRVLAVAAYDARGAFLAGDAVPVEVAVEPRVELLGLEPGQEVTGAVTLRVAVNFLATHVRYERVDPVSGRASAIADADPYGPFAWAPSFADNGPARLRAVAYDRLGRPLASAEVDVQVRVPRSLRLVGVGAGARIERPVTLGYAANFPVREARFLLRHPDGGAPDAGGAGEEVLGTVGPGGRLRWLPRPDQAGPRLLAVAVQDADGAVHESPPVPVEVAAAPGVFLETVGPGQVIAGTVELRALANVPLQAVEFRLLDEAGRVARTVAGGGDPGATYRWTPAERDAGPWRLQAVGIAPDGQRIEGEAVPVRVHVGPVYGPKPVAPRDRFVALARRLAQEARDRTGMSAALQVAQAILESGWGQSVPVDRYTGRLSYNLFGIKGTGPAGSVLAATWEEYRGIAYRTDARFRAYRSVRESWDDHKQLLLRADRYAPFRAVMHEPTLGAWALRRAGYATDSRYALKLIRLVEEQRLHELDEVAP